MGVRRCGDVIGRRKGWTDAKERESAQETAQGDHFSKDIAKMRGADYHEVLLPGGLKD